MRHWGIVITIFYALVLIFLLSPGAGLIFLKMDSWKDFYAHWFFWLWIAIFVGGQGLLIFLTVDTSQKRLRYRQHILISVAASALLFALLTMAFIYSLVGGIFGDHSISEFLFSSRIIVLALWIGLWLVWIIIFYIYFRESSKLLTKTLSWLLKGSVLELLVAVTCHIIVRQRGDCSAPILTGFGVTAGIALMLLCFGPSVLLLYKKRLNSYKIKNASADK